MDAMSDDPNPWQRSQPHPDPWAPPAPAPGDEPPAPPQAVNPYAAPSHTPPPPSGASAYPTSAPSAPYPPHPQQPGYPQATYPPQNGPAQQPYAPGAYAGGAAYGPAPTPSQRGNALGGLIDFSFATYATPAAAKAIYILAIVAFVGGWLGDVLNGLQGYPVAMASPFLTLLFGWVPALLGICLVRAGLEGVLALIRTHERAERTADDAGDSSDAGTSAA